MKYELEEEPTLIKEDNNTNEADGNSITEKDIRTLEGLPINLTVKENKDSFGMIVNISLAVNDAVEHDDGTIEDVTTWYKLVMFGKTAELANKKITKGCKIKVTGEYKLRQWKDKQGKKQQTNEIAVKKLKILTQAKNNNEDEEQEE